jgi:hypothetical protein
LQERPLVRLSQPQPFPWQDAQIINYFDHLDHLDETKDLAAKVIKLTAKVIKLVDHVGGAEEDLRLRAS